jgi:hypothetical protein
MADGRTSRAQFALSGFCVAMFTIALGALVSSQLSLMSVLDPARAQRAADQIATSRFTADVIEQTVERAVTPIAGNDIAARLAAVTSTDPQVTGVVSSSLIGAHRQIVDPDAPSAPDGNVAVRRAIAQSVLDSASAAGFDPVAAGIDPNDLDALQLDAAAEQAGLPSVVPSNVPQLGLRQVAETTRVIAAVVLLVFGVVAVLAHPSIGSRAATAGRRHGGRLRRVVGGTAGHRLDHRPGGEHAVRRDVADGVERRRALDAAARRCGRGDRCGRGVRRHRVRRLGARARAPQRLVIVLGG